MYATTKAAVMMFTRCCASLKEECNVRVAGMLPGLVDTPILDTTGAGGKSEWMKMVLANNEACRPEDIAEGVMARSEEHTSELQSLMRISYAVFCLKKKKSIKNA